MGTQSHEEFPRVGHRKATGGENPVEHVQFPRFGSRDAASGDPHVPLSSDDGSSLDATSDVADAVTQMGIFVRCLTFLKRVGVGLVVPPYTVDEGVSNYIDSRNGHINLVSLRCTVARHP